MSDVEESRIFTVRVERPATGGAVGRADDGKVVFIRHALPGELVDVQITDETSKFYRGEAITISEPSADRVTPPCPYAHPFGCGGCDLQHASATAQSYWKQAVVEEHLRRIAGLDRTVTVRDALGPVKGSRTRLRCAVNSEGQLSLRASRSHELIGLEACWIADEDFGPAFANSWLGVAEVELRAIGEGEPFAVARREDDRGTTFEVRSMTGAPLHPSTQSRVDVLGHVFSVSPLSFWQSHREAPATLLETVLRFANAQPGDDVVDLYSGVGLFAVPLAKRVGVGGRVTSVESSPHAVRDARENATGLRHLKVREWSVTARSVNDTVREGAIVVLDPPRTGLARGVIESLVRRRPRRIVYVSCDAATFARDLKTFLSNGFTVADLEVFDFFPMTEHIELVALLDSPS